MVSSYVQNLKDLERLSHFLRNKLKPNTPSVSGHQDELSNFDRVQTASGCICMCGQLTLHRMNIDKLDGATKLKGSRGHETPRGVPIEL